MAGNKKPMASSSTNTQEEGKQEIISTNRTMTAEEERNPDGTWTKDTKAKTWTRYLAMVDDVREAVKRNIGNFEGKLKVNLIDVNSKGLKMAIIQLNERDAVDLLKNKVRLDK